MSEPWQGCNTCTARWRTRASLAEYVAGTELRSAVMRWAVEEKEQEASLQATWSVTQSLYPEPCAPHASKGSPVYDQARYGSSWSLEARAAGRRVRSQLACECDMVCVRE